MLHIHAEFDPNTFSYSYVVWDDTSRQAAIIDPVYDFDPVAGRLCPRQATQLLAVVSQHQLQVQWILETHVHADHLSAAQYLKSQVGGVICIGAQVSQVQSIFAGVFNLDADFSADGHQFDRLLTDGEQLPLGELSIGVMATPGHTPACVTYLIEDAAFVGDTLFMPDYGTARADFPGGDAARLFDSIQRILSLPDATRLFMCHDYGTAERRDFQNQTTVAAERDNVHLGGVSREEFVRFRQNRDAELSAPRLLYPAVQFNMRAGLLPPPEANGAVYFKTPVQVDGSG